MAQQELERRIDELLARGNTDPSRIAAILGVARQRVIATLRHREGRDHLAEDQANRMLARQRAARAVVKNRGISHGRPGSGGPDAA